MPRTTEASRYRSPARGGATHPGRGSAPCSPVASCHRLPARSRSGSADFHPGGGPLQPRSPEASFRQLPASGRIGHPDCCPPRRRERQCPDRQSGPLAASRPQPGRSRRLWPGREPMRPDCYECPDSGHWYGPGPGAVRRRTGHAGRGLMAP